MAYETGFQTLMPTAGNGIIKTVFLLVYFAVSFYFVIDRSNVIDKVGKYLTPVLLILMISIVIWTFADPLGAPVETGVENPFYLGFITGYQTGDVLTGLLFGVLFVGAVKEKGYSDDQVFLPIILGAAVITFIGLFIIYGGLLYLGATGSGVLDGETSRASLLPDLVQKMAGALGANVLAASVMMACLTTAVGATAVMANYIEKWTGGRISYAAGAMVTTAVALFQAFGGVDKIVVIAGPIFMLMYPVGICIAVLGIFCRFFENDGIWKGMAFMAVLIGIYDSLSITGTLLGFQIPAALEGIYNAIPLSKQGFAWLVPAIAGGIIGGIFWKTTGRASIGNGPAPDDPFHADIVKDMPAASA